VVKLDTYPAEYTLPNHTINTPLNVNGISWHKVHYPKVDERYPRGNLRADFNQLVEQDVYVAPLRGVFFAAGFAFMPADALGEVPFDPYMDWDEEEMSYSLRLWTYGWNIYTPKRHLLYHLYAVRRSDAQSHNFRKHIQDSTLHARYRRSKKRYFHLLGIIKTDDKAAILEVEKYGLGKERTLRGFEAFSGVYLATQRLSVRGMFSWFASNSEAHIANGKNQEKTIEKMYHKLILKSIEALGIKKESIKRQTLATQLDDVIMHVDDLLKEKKSLTVEYISPSMSKVVGAISFDMGEYLYGLRYFDCHQGMTKQGLLEVDMKRMRESYLFRAVMARVEGLLGWELGSSVCKVHYSTENSMTLAVTNHKNITMIPLLPVPCSVKIDGHSVSSHSVVQITVQREEQMICSFDGDEGHREWAVMVLADKS